jgi:RimJ/RimL family protein N-acetyltransferase
MHIFLDTARLRLRRLSETDLDDLVELHNDPEVMRFINGGRPVSRETVRDDHLARMLRTYPGIANPAYWAAEDRSAGGFLGWFQFRPLEDDSCDVVELGYRLRRSAWGQGYAAEGSRALIRKGFTELGVRRIVANTMAVNTRSRRVMEKVGLTYRRTFTEDWPDAIEGSEHGEVEYDLTREGWEKSDAGAGA